MFLVVVVVLHSLCNFGPFSAIFSDFYRECCSGLTPPRPNKSEMIGALLSNLPMVD